MGAYSQPSTVTTKKQNSFSKTMEPTTGPTTGPDEAKILKPGSHSERHSHKPYQLKKNNIFIKEEAVGSMVIPESKPQCKIFPKLCLVV